MKNRIGGNMDLVSVAVIITTITFLVFEFGGLMLYKIYEPDYIKEHFLLGEDNFCYPAGVNKSTYMSFDGSIFVCCNKPDGRSYPQYEPNPLYSVIDGWALAFNNNHIIQPHQIRSCRW